MKLILSSTYDIDFEDYDINHINKIAKTYDKIFKSIVFWLYHLQGKKPEKIKLFQDTKF